MARKLTTLLAAATLALSLSGFSGARSDGALTAAHAFLIQVGAAGVLSPARHTVPAAATDCLSRHRAQLPRNDCLEAVLEHTRPTLRVNSALRAACAALSPHAQDQLVRYESDGGVGVNDFLIAVLLVGGGGSAADCQDVLAANDAIGAVDVPLLGVTDQKALDASTSPARLPVTLASLSANRAEIRFGTSHKTIPLLHSGGKWLIASLDFAR